MTESEEVLKLQDIVVRRSDETILSCSQLTVGKGEVLAIIGPNGAGKSTLLKVASLLESPASGEVRLFGENVGGQELPFRRRMATVYQRPLLLDGTVRYNVGTGLRYRGLPNSKIEREVERWLKSFDISRLADRHVSTLSGGEAQRVNLARAFCVDPEIIFLDEPFSALDAPTREDLLVELSDVLNRTETTALFVTHDFRDLPVIADRVAVLIDGQLVQNSTVEDALYHPRSVKVARFVGVENIWQGVARKDGIVEVDWGAELKVADADGHVGSVQACVRPEAIKLFPRTAKSNHIGRTSEHNTVFLTVTAVHPASYYVKVELATGAETMKAIHPRGAGSSWEPQVGENVGVVLPPDFVHLIAGN